MPRESRVAPPVAPSRTSAPISALAVAAGGVTWKFGQRLLALGLEGDRHRRRHGAPSCRRRSRSSPFAAAKLRSRTTTGRGFGSEEVDRRVELHRDRRTTSTSRVCSPSPDRSSEDGRTETERRLPTGPERHLERQFGMTLRAPDEKRIAHGVEPFDGACRTPVRLGDLLRRGHRELQVDLTGLLFSSGTAGAAPAGANARQPRRGERRRASG